MLLGPYTDYIFFPRHGNRGLEILGNSPKVAKPEAETRAFSSRVVSSKNLSLHALDHILSQDYLNDGITFTPVTV